AHTACLSHAERRKVVVKHEVLALLALVAFEALAVVRGSQCGGNQRLGLAAGKQCRSMRARKDTCLNSDGTNFVECASIGADAVLGHLFAERTPAQMLVVGC